MIFISRNRSDDHGNPIQPSQIWFNDAAVKTTQAIADGANHQPDGAVYGHDDLRRALLKLFHDKCAYCETKISGIFDWEVEHFRPKKSVAESPNHPGYYWLTYEWENLYTGCTHCNQRRRDRGTWGNPQGTAPAGKMDQFPLRDENLRAMNHNENIMAEEPVRLVIDPCKDDPELELTFDKNGEILAINQGDRATRTIDVLHLDRSDLVKNRRLHVELLRNTIDLLHGQLASGTSKVVVRDAILSANTGDNHLYAALVRAIQRDPGAFGF
jgi:uncharacterized protein (TIGR02646 family)